MKKSAIFFALILLSLATYPVFAQTDSIISVKTDKSSYESGNIVVISGKVTTIVAGTPVTLQIFNPTSNMVEIAQFLVAQDGSYTHTVNTESALWSTEGEYTVKVSYGEGKSSETTFTFTPKKAGQDVTEIFDVNVGSSGTFDIKYTIRGGTVKNMIVDPDSFALIVIIDSTDSGSITLELPREFIDAKKQDGTDDTFIILIDGMEVPYQESIVNSNARVVTINFESGDSDIEIIGTFVIPEFGTVAVIVLAMTLTLTIVLARKRTIFNY